MENTKTTGNSIQHIFKSLQQFQRSGSWKFVFLFKGTAVFKQCIAKKYKCLGMKTHKLCNSTGYTLQHQSVLGEGQTMPSPTADSSTCHSDTTACGSKGMSSQTAYEEFLLFPSPIWWPDKEKYLLLRDCHYQTVRTWHRTLDRKKLNWMGWPLRKDQGDLMAILYSYLFIQCSRDPQVDTELVIIIVEGEEMHSCCTSRR